MERILVINGPNMNFLGIRQPEIYGFDTYDDLCGYLQQKAVKLGLTVSFFQSNHEGDLIDALQDAYEDDIDGVILNAAAYTHTSIALRDAIESMPYPVVEVHMSDPEEREDFRKTDLIKDVCAAYFAGERFLSYGKALQFLADLQKTLA